MPFPLAITPQRRLRLRFRWSMGIMGLLISLLLLGLYLGQVGLHRQSQHLQQLQDYQQAWREIGRLGQQLYLEPQAPGVQQRVQELEQLLFQVNEQQKPVLQGMLSNQHSSIKRLYGLPPMPVDSTALVMEYQQLRNNIQQLIHYFRFGHGAKSPPLSPPAGRKLLDNLPQYQKRLMDWTQQNSSNMEWMLGIQRNLNLAFLVLVILLVLLTSRLFLYPASRAIGEQVDIIRNQMTALRNQKEELRDTNQKQLKQEQELKATNKKLQGLQQQLEIQLKNYRLQIDHQRDMRRRVETAQQALKENQQHHQKLLRQLSHEFGNPLNGLLGMARLLDEQLQDNPQHPEKHQEAAHLRERAEELARIYRRLQELLQKSPEETASNMLQNPGELHKPSSGEPPAPTAGSEFGQRIDETGNQNRKLPPAAASGSTGASYQPAHVPEDQASILLVEDDQVNALYIRKRLEKWGYRTRLAKNGEEGLIEYRKTPPALIITDSAMPVMDGVAMVTEIRREEAKHTHQTPIIAVSAYNLQEDLQRLYEAGINEFLGKPVQESALRQAIAHWLNTQPA